MESAYIALLVGMVSRMLLPWLHKVYVNVRNDKERPDWEWRFLLGQALGFIILVAALPVVAEASGITIADVAHWDLQPAFLAGYGAADLGRLLDKFATGHNTLPEKDVHYPRGG